MATTPTYPISVIAQIMGIDEHTIRRLARKGILTRPTVRGEWAITIVAQYIAHIEQQQRDDIDAGAMISPIAAASLLNLTPRRLRGLAQESKIPKADHGKYPLIGIVQGYVEYLQHLKSGTDRRQAEALRLTSVRADTYAVDLAIKNGRLYNADDVDHQLFEVCTTLTAMLDGSASRIASSIGGGATLRAKLIDEFRGIRNTFAAGLRKYSRRIEQGRDDSRSADRPRARRVGKKQPGIAKR